MGQLAIGDDFYYLHVEGTVSDPRIDLYKHRVTSIMQTENSTHYNAKGGGSAGYPSTLCFRTVEEATAYLVGLASTNYDLFTLRAHHPTIHV